MMVRSAAVGLARTLGVWASLAASSALLGCRTPPCPTFDELAVTNPDGVADTDAIAEAERAVADFRAWSGLDAVCVDEVRLVEEIETDGPDIGGLYRPEEHIELEVDVESVYSLALHELCHAWDSNAGLPSVAHPDVFPASEIKDLARYPTVVLRAAEVLARACEEGAADWSVLEALGDHCGRDDLFTERRRYLLEHLWLDREAGDRPIGPAFAGDVALELEVHPGESRSRRAPYRWKMAYNVAAVGEGLLIEAGTYPDDGHAAVFLDLESDRLTGLSSLPGHLAGWVPIASEGRLLMVQIRGELLLRLDGDGAHVQPRPRVGHPWFVVGGALSGSVLLLYTYDVELEEDPRLLLWRVDPGTGDADVLDLPIGYEDAVISTAISPTGDGGFRMQLAVNEGDPREAVIRYDPDLGWGEPAALPGWVSPRVDRYAVADDVVIRTPWVRAGDATAQALEVLDLTTGDRWLDTSGCELGLGLSSNAGHVTASGTAIIAATDDDWDSVALTARLPDDWR